MKSEPGQDIHSMENFFPIFQLLFIFSRERILGYLEEEWYIQWSLSQWKDLRATYKYSCHDSDLVKQSLWCHWKDERDQLTKTKFLSSSMAVLYYFLMSLEFQLWISGMLLRRTLMRKF